MMLKAVIFFEIEHSYRNYFKSFLLKMNQSPKVSLILVIGSKIEIGNCLRYL